MSGPKVVRVKTRAERIAEAQVWIARVGAAARRWERQVCDADLATPEEVALTRGRAAALAGSLARDRFEEVERHARQEIAFLAEDLGRRTERASQVRARQRTRRRRLATTAASLLAALATAGRPVPPEIDASLQAGRVGAAEDLDALEAVIAEAVSYLVPVEDAAGRRERQAALAAQLGTGEATRTLADWLAQRPSEDDAVGGRVDDHIARLEAEAGIAAGTSFAERARLIATEPSARRRRLLADSLELDLAATLKQGRVLSRLRSELEDLAAEIGLLEGNADAAVLLAEIHGASAADSAALTALRDRVAAWLLRHRADAAALARREAVLSALSAIGYEVREGMGAAWAEGRRLVVRRGGGQDLGLELAGEPGAARLQVRAVGFEVGAGGWDHTRDRDVEHLFCGDLGRLQEQLAEHGGEMVLERAVPVGAQPIRTVAGSEGRVEGHAAAPLQRKLERHQ